MATPILGVRIDTVTKTQALEQAKAFLVSGQHTIFTPNPEMLVKASEDSYFKEVLNRGDLNLCDGFGLWAAVKWQVARHHHPLEGVAAGGVSPDMWHPESHTPRPATADPLQGVVRITGVDFMLELCHMAVEQGSKVFLLGGGDGMNDVVVNKTKEELMKKFPNLKIVGVDKGIKIEERRIKTGETVEESSVFSLQSGLNYFEAENNTVIAEINQKQPDILFVAFGMGKQEKWIVENLHKMPSVKIAMGVGGSFDYISGTIPRAPLLMRQFGLEWLYRLVKQPRRIGRIWNATFTFIWLLITKK